MKIGVRISQTMALALHLFAATLFVACDLLLASMPTVYRLNILILCRVRVTVGGRHSSVASTLNCVSTKLLTLSLLLSLSVPLICLHSHLNPRDEYHRHRMVFAKNTFATCVFCLNLHISSEHTHTYSFCHPITEPKHESEWHASYPNIKFNLLQSLHNMRQHSYII